MVNVISHRLIAAITLSGKILKSFTSNNQMFIILIIVGNDFPSVAIVIRQENEIVATHDEK